MSPLSGSLTSAPRRAISTRSALISFATGSVGRRSYDCLRRCRSSSSGRTFGRSASACDLVNVGIRSEEHTSELQSLTNLVCRLLLEKKKIYKQKDKTAKDDENT